MVFVQVPFLPSKVQSVDSRRKPKGMTEQLERQKVWFVEGNIKTGKGIIKGLLPFVDIASSSDSSWQFGITGLSFVSKTNISQSVYLSSNLLQDIILTPSSQRQIWNPYVIHLRLSGLSNSYTLPLIWYTITNHYQNVEFYVTNLLDKKPFDANLEVSLTVVFRKIEKNF